MNSTLSALTFKKHSLSKLLTATFATAATLGAMTTTLTVDAATLVENVKGYTLNEKGELTTFKNLLLDEGKVVALDIEKGKTSVDDTIDGEGKVMLPGLIDAHGHLLGLGANLLEVDLRESKSAKDAAKMVAEYAFANGQQAWITGRGWN